MTLEIAGLTWWYDRGRPVIDALDLSVPPGAIVSISGPNGCGKSTLLRLIAGIVEPRSGTVSRPRRVGYLPQSSEEPPVRLRATKWLDAVAQMKGSDSATMDQHARSLSVDQAIHGPLASLSVGTIAKVMVLGAFVGDPELIVLDEPFASLDAASREALTRMISETAAKGVSFVVTSHDEMPTLGGTQLTLVNGKLHW